MTMDELKKLIKLLRLPAGGQSAGRKYTWSSRGGFAGQKTMSAVETAAEALGWSPSNGTNGAGDGSTTRNTTTFVSPEGHKLTTSQFVGSTKSDNTYSITLSLATVQESNTVKLNAKQLRHLINETIRNQVNESSSPYESAIVEAVDGVVSAVEEFMGSGAVNSQRLSDALWEVIDNELVESGSSDGVKLPPPHPAGSMKDQW